MTEENLALHEGVKEIANAVAVGGASIEHQLHLGAVSESNGGAGRVERELVQQIAGELSRVAGEDRFQVADVLKPTAVEELARSIDGFGELKGEVVSGSINAADALALFDAAIPRAPAAEDVEVLQCESDRIEAACQATEISPKTHHS